jgi:hypothetical protein
LLAALFSAPALAADSDPPELALAPSLPDDAPLDEAEVDEPLAVEAGESELADSVLPALPDFA